MQKYLFYIFVNVLAWKPANAGVANENVKKQSSVYMT